MLEELQPAIRFAIMSILATVYESGLVEEVDMADVMRLFGAEPEEGIDTTFSFRDASWVDAYIDFRESDGAEFFADDLEDDDESLINAAVAGPDGKLH